MSDIFFADISNFQDSADLPTYRKTNAVIICQINWGTSVTVPAGRVAEIRALKFAIVVWYIGLVATQDVGAQVAAFLRTIGPLQPGEAVCIDWESTPGQGTPTAAQRDEAANLIAQGRAIPVAMVGVYGSPSNLDGSPALGWQWVAAYEEPEPGTPHVFWQFTNGQYTSGPYGPVNFPGIGFVDGSVFHGTVDQLAASIVPNAAPTPQPKEDPVGSSSFFKRTTADSPLGPGGGLLKGSLIVVEINPHGGVYVKNADPTLAVQSAKNQSPANSAIPGTLSADLNSAGTGIEGVWQNTPDGVVTYFNIPGELNADGTVLVGLGNLP